MRCLNDCRRDNGKVSVYVAKLFDIVTKMEAGLMIEIDSVNGSGIDENIPVFKIEVGLIEITFPVNTSWMNELSFPFNRSWIDENNCFRN